jgi:hypothetical protein
VANPQNLKPFTGADDPRRSNGKPKGTKHLSTWIQEMMNDEDFETYLQDAKDGWKPFKGAPVKAIVRVAMIKSLAGDKQWADWLANHGYGQKMVHSNDPENPMPDGGVNDPALVAEWTEYLKQKSKDEQP